MSKTLHIADGLSLPIDAATQTFAFIARKGAGKTYTAGKLVELLLEAHVQVVVLDTVGNWYGLRIAADGKGTGFDVPVLGGLRGDIPLEATGGALIADIIVDTGRSFVLDASQFSLADRKRFATALGERLWLRKKGERQPAPLHLVIEESQLIVPQFTGAGGGDVARMLGVFEEIIRLGRNYGIGVSMITQRPQSVSKEVLNQTECLFVGQVNGTQERDALKRWITHKGMDVHLVDELPGLAVGTFYVWSPQWLDLLKRVLILKKKTFDASATPKVGDKSQGRRELKPLNLADLEEQLKATIERQKADDPRELRKRIAELERQLKAVPEPTVEQVPALTDENMQALRYGLVTVKEAIQWLQDWKKGIEDKLELAELLTTGEKARNRREIAARDNGHRQPARATPARPAPRREPAEGVTGPQQKILDSLAWLGTIGLYTADRVALAMLADASPSSSAYANNLGALRTAGRIDYPEPGRVALTDDGRKAACIPDALLTPEMLQRSVREKVSAPQWRILEQLIAVYPKSYNRGVLAEEAGASETSSAYANNLGALRTLGLLTYPGNGLVAASPLLFLEGSR